jgi:hypothetical protein
MRKEPRFTSFTLLGSSTREGTFMRKLTSPSVGILILACLSTLAQAQVTNPIILIPATKLESYDTNVGVVVLKCSTEVGAISADAGEVRVRCKEITDTSTGHKEQGLTVEIDAKGQFRSVLQIDYDEIAALLAGMDYLTRLDVSATPLTTFDAAYTTKGGFRVAALGTRRTGAIQFGVRDARTLGSPVVFSRDEMSRLSGLINQAKGTLDSLH